MRHVYDVVVSEDIGQATGTGIRLRHNGSTELHLFEIVLKAAMDNRDNTELAPPRRALPSHVILLADWGSHPASRVLPADVDLIGQLDVEGVKYRPATEFERHIGGFIE
jgi:hypothetical protein